MDNLDLFEQILDIDKVILSNSKKHKKETSLAEEYIYKDYDLLSYKKRFLVLFNDFVNVRNSYKFISKNYGVQITSKMDSIIVDKNRKVCNPVLNFIENKIDDQIKITDLYIALVHLSNKFTYYESVYFISTFINRNTENETARLLYMTKPSMDKYKKSCLFKMVMDLEKFL